jgi:hypothetical protein
VVGYRVYFGTASRTYQQALGLGFDAGKSASYTVSGLTAGWQYFFAVTSVDANANESAYSAEATKLTP